MADDNFVRSYRSNEPARRANAAAAPLDSARDIGGSDPLAELARLIGQSDPFTDLERNSGHSTEARPRTDSPPSDWRKTAAALARESMRAPPAADPHFDEVDSAIAAAKSLRATPQDQFAPPATSSFDQAALAPDDYADSQYAASQYTESHHADGPYADNHYHDEPGIDAGIDDRFHNAHHAGTPQGGQQSDSESENNFFDGAAAPADERFYDDPPRSRATNGVLTAVVLVGCGILGTAGAYGYRTYYSGARATDAPIISAEKSPNKMVPAPAAADAGKSVQDRVGDKAANERVVARQEEPVAFPNPNDPRAVLPAPFTTSPGPGPSVPSSPPAQSGAGSAPAAGATEPKKVHTLAIRPDGVEPMTRPVGGAAGAPLQTAPSSPPVAATRPPPAAKPAPAPRGNGGPLSLEPQAQEGDTTSSYQSAPRERATPAPASGPRLASTSSTVAGGGYVVQISSQRNEADAQASFHSLQAKFPKELGDREVIVRRADLGQKGIYYRAMVGPFGTAGDADQFCSGLKAAGGQCIVQKN
ncbi:MAG TPA: SPOR domain-containing protein [Xanthobacteraceae bacterium]